MEPAPEQNEAPAAPPEVAAPPKRDWSWLRVLLLRVLTDVRSYYAAAAIVVFYLLSSRASQGMLGVLGYSFLLALLLGTLWIETRRRVLARDLEAAQIEQQTLRAKVEDLEAVLLNHRIQQEAERLRPISEEIQRRLLETFPDIETAFAVAENEGYVYPDELVLTAKARDGRELSPEAFTQVLTLARDAAKELEPELAIHWA